MPATNTAERDDADARVRLDLFDSAKGLDRGRSRAIEALWHLCKCAFFLSALPWPSAFKRGLLRAFGAHVGRGVVIKPRVNVLFPWKLVVGDHCWLGEEAWLLNFEPLTLGDHVCVSQRAFLCGGNHDFRAPDFAYRNGPIHVETGAWIGACTFVGPGTTIGANAVVTAGSVVTRDLPGGMICAGNPCTPLRARFPAEEPPLPRATARRAAASPSPP